MSRFGKYALIQKLASGGMGEVFLAQAEGAEKLLVLKRILPHLSADKQFLDLFLDEARIVARLNHPNVVQIFELGSVDGSWYLLMEYVRGKDLRQITQTRRRLPLGLACRIVADAAAGLDCAHQAKDAQGRPMQIVHRDVSPHNVLVSFDGAVKLIDFGVAKAAGRIPQPEVEMLHGKYPYMSPEQATDAQVDHRSDQFSLGVVLWELLSGRRLFEADNDAVTLQRVAECAVAPPSRKDEVLPQKLVELVMRALQKDPSNRFPDMAAFGAGLADVMTAGQWPAGKDDLATFLQALFPDALATSSRPVSALTVPARIAVPATSFVGRTVELVALRQLLSHNVRLLSLLGPAGCGKSRLAIQLALGASSACLVDCSEATGVGDLCTWVAHALEVRLTGEDSVEQVGRLLAQRPGLLLVLDNFEPLIPGGPEAIGKWMAAAPEATLVLTARDALGLDGVVTWNVPALAESAELFLQRARAAPTTWVPTSSQSQRVDRLGGIALAIELAAARSASGFDLLTQGNEIIALRAVIDASWKLLADHEQLALAQLSVFRGRFSLEAAEAVIALASFPKAPWALDVVQALRGWGLLEVAQVAGQLQFALSGTIRAYAFEKLAELGPDSSQQARARQTASSPIAPR